MIRTPIKVPISMPPAQKPASHRSGCSWQSRWSPRNKCVLKNPEHLDVLKNGKIWMNFVGDEIRSGTTWIPVWD